VTAERAPHADPSRWRDLVVVVAPLLAVVSVAAYAVVHISYERFYAQFGLVPEDVGANSSTILAQSGAHVLVYLILFAIVPYGVTLGAFYLAARRLTLKSVTRTVAVIVIALLPLAVYEKLTGGGIRGGYMAVVLVGLVVLSFWVRRKGFAETNWGHVVLLWCSFGVVWLSVYYLPGAAERAGQCIVGSPGQGLRFVHTRRSLPGSGPSAVLNLPVEPAAVTWIGDPAARPSLGENILYLGQAGSTVILFDPTRSTVVRLPAADALIRTRAKPPLCHDVAWKQR
jgi:hypothetical protein